jgi:hypothetical protein
VDALRPLEGKMQGDHQKHACLLSGSAKSRPEPRFRLDWLGGDSRKLFYTIAAFVIKTTK